METRTTDVTVAGAGPTGLMLATELALAGIDVTVLDRLPARSGQSKALNLQPRTAEVFDLRGLLAHAREQSIGIVADGHFAALPVPLSYAGWQSRHPYQVGIPQARVEQVLEARLGEHGTDVCRGHAIEDLTQDGDWVHATVHGPDGPYLLRSRYLVGCDGGRSTVRKQLGVAFPGTEAHEYGVVADVVLSAESDAPSQLRSMRDALPKQDAAGGFAGLIPLGEPHLFRLAYRHPQGRPVDPRSAVPASEVEEVVAYFYGDRFRIEEIHWASRFGDAARQAEQYRTGRVLLAGDAAHIHFPAGGQGLNLGVQDAMNLGWKLAAELNGWAPAGLLDSYHAERHPVGARVLNNTRAQGRLGGLHHDDRAAALRELFTELMTLPDTNRYLAGMISGLDIRYPMSGPDVDLLGRRLPDTELTVSGRSRWASELLHPGRGVLFAGSERYQEAARPWADRVDSVAVSEIPGVAASALVRPDGYVCWLASDPEDPATESDKWLDAALRTWFGEPSAG